MTLPNLRPRERDALIQSLRSGVTPRTGARHIQVGRGSEIAALDKDLDRIAEGGASFRLIVGDFGSGKTFFLNLLRGEAMARQLVVAHADLNPGRRLHASGGEARSLYAELMKNLASRTKPEGGALTTVVEKFITTALAEARKSDRKPEEVIHEKLEALSELVMGYDFATVIAAYWRAYEKDDDALKTNAIRWLRGEFSAKTDARAALGVREKQDEALSDRKSIDELTDLHNIEIIKRLERLDARFDDVFGRIETLAESNLQSQSLARAAIDLIKQHSEFISTERGELRSKPVEPPLVARNNQSIDKPATELSLLSLHQVIEWLTTQESVPLAELRIHLLPLDLLPNAVINDFNERALDLIGEPALIEEGDTVIVQREVLLQVIAG